MRIVDDSLIPGLINKLQSGLVALAYADGDVMSIWLTDQSQTEKVGRVAGTQAESVRGGNPASPVGRFAEAAGE